MYQDTDSQWVASCSKIPGLVVKAKTPEEAVEKMKHAVAFYFPCGECKGSPDPSP
jgi:predicted RNase H-like HicB family nuclease